jgi:hypothetical protein
LTGESVCHKSNTITLPLRYGDLVELQLAGESVCHKSNTNYVATENEPRRSADGTNCPRHDAVSNGRITQTATRVLALSSRTPALTFCFQTQLDIIIIQSAVMPIFRTDIYGINNGTFFECCQQNKNKHDEDEINKLALCVEQCFVLRFSGTGK